MHLTYICPNIGQKSSMENVSVKDYWYDLKKPNNNILFEKSAWVFIVWNCNRSFHNCYKEKL